MAEGEIRRETDLPVESRPRHRRTGRQLHAAESRRPTGGEQAGRDQQSENPDRESRGFRLIDDAPSLICFVAERFLHTVGRRREVAAGDARTAGNIR